MSVKRMKIKEQSSVVVVVQHGKRRKADDNSQLALTWHLEWTAGVRAGW